MVDSLLAESDSLRWFLIEKVRRQDGSDLSVAEIVQAYADYCPDKGWQPMKDSQIGSRASGYKSHNINWL